MAVDRVNHLPHEIDTAMEGAIGAFVVSGRQQLALMIQRLEKLIEQCGNCVPLVFVLSSNRHGIGRIRDSAQYPNMGFPMLELANRDASIRSMRGPAGSTTNRGLPSARDNLRSGELGLSQQCRRHIGVVHEALPAKSD